MLIDRERHLMGQRRMRAVPPFQILNRPGSLRVPSDTSQYQAPFLVRLAAFNIH